MNEKAKKKIEIYVIHPEVRNVEQMISLFCMETLQESYDFVWNSQKPQYIIVSEHIFYKRKYLKEFKKFFDKRVISIYWAGECIAPDMNVFDYAVCWDRNLHLNDRIVRVPPANIFFKSFVFSNRRCLDRDCLEDIIKKKKNFCNFIYSNPDAHPMRDMIFRKISKYKRVDSYGKHLNNVGIRGTGFSGHSKDTTLLKDSYKFSIASENATYDGYTSEKLLTCLQAHTVPIYWGNPHIATDYNENAFLNVNNFATLDLLIDEIKKIDESDELWYQIVSQPWQTKDQQIKSKEQMERYIEFFHNIFSQDYLYAHRIPEGYHPNKYRRFFFESQLMWKIEIYDLYKIVKNRLSESKK